MPLSWNEIKSRALAFSKHWADAGNEDAEAKPFLIDFFEIFGITDTDKQRTTIEAAAQAVLDARAAHPGATLADLYDPLTMPPDLVKVHQKLDAAVDAAYGYKGAATDAARVAFLFSLYQQIAGLLPAEKVPSRQRRLLKEKA